MIRTFAFYFPQFYSIEENDNWWGKGFTDWDLVKKAKPLVREQVQPRIPLLGYRDQSRPDVVLSQSQLAKQYGLSGFNFYHYWFDGQILLDVPMTNFLLDKTIDIEFMWTWANESWTRQWVGRPNDYLVRQTYSSVKEKVENHYRYLRSFFKDSRYVKIAGSPVFCIYRPELIPNLSLMQRHLQDFAIKDGFSGIHFIACRSFNVSNAARLYSSFDGVINFNPRYVLNNSLRLLPNYQMVLESFLRRIPEKVQSILASMIKRGAVHQAYNYRFFLTALAAESKDSSINLPIYPCVFPDWDNTARYGEKATFFTGSTPELFADAVRISCEAFSKDQPKLLFINAWNEWSEAAYLEPDQKHGTAYLEALQQVLTSYAASAR